MASDNLLIMATHLRPRSLFLAATLTLMQYVLASKDVGLIADTPNAELIADVPNGMQLPSVQTVSVNRYGSMCPAPSISTSTSTHMAPSTPTTASATLTRPWIWVSRPILELHTLHRPRLSSSKQQSVSRRRGQDVRYLLQCDSVWSDCLPAETSTAHVCGRLHGVSRYLR